MMKDFIDVGKWVETANCFEVMGQLRRLEVLSREDIGKAMRLNRLEWIDFIKEKLGLAPEKKNEGDYA